MQTLQETLAESILNPSQTQLTQMDRAAFMEHLINTIQSEQKRPAVVDYQWDSQKQSLTIKLDPGTEEFYWTPVERITENGIKLINFPNTWGKRLYILGSIKSTSKLKIRAHYTDVYLGPKNPQKLSEFTFRNLILDAGLVEVRCLISPNSSIDLTNTDKLEFIHTDAFAKVLKNNPFTGWCKDITVSLYNQKTDTFSSQILGLPKPLVDYIQEMVQPFKDSTDYGIVIPSKHIHPTIYKSAKKMAKNLAPLFGPSAVDNIFINIEIKSGNIGRICQLEIKPGNQCIITPIRFPQSKEVTGRLTIGI